MTTWMKPLERQPALTQDATAWLPEWVIEWASANPIAAETIGVAALLAVCAIALVIIRVGLLPQVRRVIKRGEFEWGQAFVDHRFFRRLSLVPAALILHYGLEVIPFAHEPVRTVIQHIAATVMVVAVMLSLAGLLNGINTIYSRRPEARNRPIKGYLQIVKMFVYLIGSILAICALLGQDPGLLLGGVGAMSAVLMLVFKDTILSLVASVQLTSHDMLRVGDWIEMPKFAADGDVVDIALHTVKVQNWDKTITTIPTYALISESFKNWRGMQESGGRRIKRNIHVDVSSVRFLSEEEIDRFGAFALLADYVAGKKSELEQANLTTKGDPAVNANVRRLTNVGTFRAYIVAYLRNHPRVHERMTFLVRQLQPTQHGLPIEIYIFTDTVNWGEYEAIQADIFDHLLSIIQEFGLSVYQSPSGEDLAGASAALRPNLSEPVR